MIDYIAGRMLENKDKNETEYLMTNWLWKTVGLPLLEIHLLECFRNATRPICLEMIKDWCKENFFKPAVSKTWSNRTKISPLYDIAMNMSKEVPRKPIFSCQWLTEDLKQIVADFQTSVADFGQVLADFKRFIIVV